MNKYCIIGIIITELVAIILLTLYLFIDENFYDDDDDDVKKISRE